MKYKVEYTKQAEKDLQKLDRYTKLMLKTWIEKNLLDCENPREKGKALVANLAGQWRYRVGDYRIIAQIEDYRIIILILNIGHRRDIYE